MIKGKHDCHVLFSLLLRIYYFCTIFLEIYLIVGILK